MKDPCKHQNQHVTILQAVLTHCTWKSALTTSKRLESSGSWTLMSALPTKMDSKACHFFWTSSQVLSTTSTVPSFLCQFVTISKNLGLPCTQDHVRATAHILLSASLQTFASNTLGKVTSNTSPDPETAQQQRQRLRPSVAVERKCKALFTCTYLPPLMVCRARLSVSRASVMVSSTVIWTLSVS